MHCSYSRDHSRNLIYAQPNNKHRHLALLSIYFVDLRRFTILAVPYFCIAVVLLPFCYLFRHPKRL